jgi:hypothetical protein
MPPAELAANPWPVTVTCCPLVRLALGVTVMVAFDAWALTPEPGVGDAGVDDTGAGATIGPTTGTDPTEGAAAGVAAAGAAWTDGASVVGPGAADAAPGAPRANAIAPSAEAPTAPPNAFVRLLPRLIMARPLSVGGRQRRFACR